MPLLLRSQIRTARGKVKDQKAGANLDGCEFWSVHSPEKTSTTGAQSVWGRRNRGNTANLLSADVADYIPVDEVL